MKFMFMNFTMTTTTAPTKYEYKDENLYANIFVEPLFSFFNICSTNISKLFLYCIKIWLLFFEMLLTFCVLLFFAFDGKWSYIISWSFLGDS